MKTKFIIAILILSSVVQLKAQQLSLMDHYLINRYALSPGYAAVNEAAIFLGYRNERINFPGASLINYFSLNAPINSKMAVGGSLNFDQTDVFKHITASASYTYSIKLTETQGLSFSLWGGIYENTLDFSNKNLAAIIEDPVISDKMNQRGTAIQSGFGLLYHFQKFFFGFDIPNLIETELNYKNITSQPAYHLRRAYQAHMSYPFSINNDWTIEPVAIGRYVQNAPLNWEVASMFKYKSTYWLAVNMRSSMELGFGIGGKINKLITVNYTYEYSNKNLGQYNSGTHEIGIGYNLGKRMGKYQPGPDETKLIHQIDSLTEKTQLLEQQMVKMQEENELKYNTKVAALETEIAGLKANLESLLNEMAKIKENDSDSTSVEELLSPDIEKAFYVVLDSYKRLDKAAKGAEIWKKRGYEAKLVHREGSSWYHVYSNKYDEIGDALSKMKEIRNAGLTTVWVLIYK